MHRNSGNHNHPGEKYTGEKHIEIASNVVNALSLNK